MLRKMLKLDNPSYPKMTALCIDVFQSKPERLARMLDQHWGDARNWETDELHAILQHQLAAPLAVDLSTHGSVLSLAGRPGAESITFGQLLRDRRPPLDLLQGVKEFAKAHLRQHDGSLPREVAKVLYLGSVLVACLRWDARISSLSDAKMRSGLDWAIEQPWLEPWLVDLFRQGHELFSGG